MEKNSFVPIPQKLAFPSLFQPNLNPMTILLIIVPISFILNMDFHLLFRFAKSLCLSLISCLSANLLHRHFHSGTTYSLSLISLQTQNYPLLYLLYFEDCTVWISDCTISMFFTIMPLSIIIGFVNRRNKTALTVFQSIQHTSFEIRTIQPCISSLI